MKRLVFIILCSALTVYCTDCSIELREGDKDFSLATSEACRAAYKEPNFGSTLEIPGSVKKLIEKYKQGWRELCGGKGRYSIHSLFHQAKEIEKAFSQVFETADKAVDGVDKKQGWDARFKKAEEIHYLIGGQYPSFVPLFKGSYIEHNYFEVSLSDFKEYASFGDVEDALFLKAYYELRGPALIHPWYRKTWDYGGCLRFGEYPWVDTLEKISTLKRELTNPLYRKMVLEFEDNLKDTFNRLYFRHGDGRLSDICTCGEKGAVEKDLEEILENIKSRPDYRETENAIRKTLNGVIKKEIPINSESERHCSGG